MESTQRTVGVSWLQRPEGRVAYEMAGAGPLVVCVPGMGDLRASYRFLRDPLLAAGYRVVLMDLRGHGESDTTSSRYGDEATAEDIIALLEQLGRPAVLVGNSMAAGAAVLVAAARPDLVAGLVLTGPFVRNAPVSMLTRLLLRVALAAPFAPATWNAYLSKLYAGRQPEDFGDYRRSVVSALRQSGHARAFARTTKTSHAAAEAALPHVNTPTLVLMGTLDPDFKDPRREAEWIGSQLHGEVVLVPEAGHYPQSQRPDVVAPAIMSFLQRVFRVRHAEGSRGA